MIGALAKNLIVICTLSNFESLPPQIKGKVTLTTKSYYHIKITNKNNTQVVTMSVDKNKCKKVGK